MDHLIEKTISSVNVFSGALLNVQKDVVLLPNGASATREWIRHPGAAAVIPVFENGSTVLVRQYRYAAGRAFLEVPAGKIDIEGESPSDVATRELREETGFVAGRLESLGAFYPCIGYSSEAIHTYLAYDLEQGEQELSDGEFIELVTIPLIEAIEKARNGELHDMKTIVALVRAAKHLGL